MEIPQTVSAPFSDVAYGCLQLEPKRRWKLAEIRSRLQPGIASTSQPETNTTQGAAKQQAPAQEIAKREIPSRKQESRVSPPPKQARLLPPPAKQTHKRSYAAPTIGIALLLVVLVAGPIVLRHRMAAPPQAPVSESAQKAPETKATEQLASAEPTAKLEKPAPAAAAPSSLEQVPAKAEESAPAETTPESTATAISPTPSATPSKDISTPASDAPSENGVLHEALPVVLDKARDSIRGTVRVNVKVAVDASGSVQQAELNAAGPSKYFSNIALQSAQKFKFEPAASNGGALREWILRFEFTNTGTKILAARANP
jgi:TonB family protein